MQPLNTSDEALAIKALSIQPIRLSTTPRNSIANTGAVTPSV